jgi:hypothetical protein
VDQNILQFISQVDFKVCCKNLRILATNEKNPTRIRRSAKSSKLEVNAEIIGVQILFDVITYNSVYIKKEVY